MRARGASGVIAGFDISIDLICFTGGVGAG
jgi:hypothetical protein